MTKKLTKMLTKMLGPLLYIIFTNDIPDLVHDHPVSYKDLLVSVVARFAMLMMGHIPLGAQTRLFCPTP